MSENEIANPLLAEMYWRAVIIAELEKDLANFPSINRARTRDIPTRNLYSQR
jgi:hypothetical protein